MLLNGIICSFTEVVKDPPRTVKAACIFFFPALFLKMSALLIYMNIYMSSLVGGDT